MTLRYHGNWCGPGWSNGRYQASTKGFAPPIDEFDETCRQHDFSYADGLDEDVADAEFARKNLGKGAKRTAAALAVMANKLVRTVVNKTTTMPPKQQNVKSSNRLRGTPARAPKSAPNTTRSGNDVTRNAPVSVSTRRASRAPRITPTKTGVVVAHRTFLTPIANSISFTVNSFATNPGLGSTFPWLSKIASRYDKYRFKSLRFEYRSVAATNTSGVAMMSFDYDASDAGPATKLIQAQTVPNAENNVWMNNDLVVPCDNVWRFVRQGLVTGTDIKTYDLGNMHLSTTYGNGVITGELYVEYVVELDKPTEPAAIAMTSVASGPAVAAPLYSVNATVPPVTTGAAQPFEVTSSTILTCLIPGTYMLEINLSGTTISVFNSPTTTGSISSLAVLFTSSDAVRVVRLVVDKYDTVSFSSIYAAATMSAHTIRISEFF